MRGDSGSIVAMVTWQEGGGRGRGPLVVLVVTWHDDGDNTTVVDFVSGGGGA